MVATASTHVRYWRLRKCPKSRIKASNAARSSHLLRGHCSPPISAAIPFVFFVFDLAKSDGHLQRTLLLKVMHVVLRLVRMEIGDSLASCRVRRSHNLEGNGENSRNRESEVDSFYWKRAGIGFRGPSSQTVTLRLLLSRRGSLWRDDTPALGVQRSLKSGDGDVRGQRNDKLERITINADGDLLADRLWRSASVNLEGVH
jgi:hypothetical protein